MCLVTGSDRVKTIEQVGEYIYSKCERVYQCSGNDVWQGDRNIRTNSWKLPKRTHSWLEDKLEEVILVYELVIISNSVQAWLTLVS